ncbi:MAG: hypothetical protein M1496_03495 [Candidatus Thermoplasmatota archaeon]|nr:hypothetical protein [Candidatus Thermoplasmatota archaeon]
MLKKGTEFIDRIDALTERKMIAMRSRAVTGTGMLSLTIVYILYWKSVLLFFFVNKLSFDLLVLPSYP